MTANYYCPLRAGLRGGHWGHLPQAPLSQGAPATEKNIIFVLVLICINVRSVLSLLPVVDWLMCHFVPCHGGLIGCLSGAPRLEIGPRSLAQDLARGPFPWPDAKRPPKSGQHDDDSVCYLVSENTLIDVVSRFQSIFSNLQLVGVMKCIWQQTRYIIYSRIYNCLMVTGPLVTLKVELYLLS